MSKRIRLTRVARERLHVEIVERALDLIASMLAADFLKRERRNKHETKTENKS